MDTLINLLLSDIQLSELNTVVKTFSVGTFGTPTVDRSPMLVLVPMTLNGRASLQRMEVDFYIMGQILSTSKDSSHIPGDLVAALERVLKICQNKVYTGTDCEGIISVVSPIRVDRDVMAANNAFYTISCTAEMVGIKLC